MYKKILFAATLLSILSITNLNAQNQSDGGVAPLITTPTISNEVFRFKQGLVTHLLNGNLPTSGGLGFTANDRWISQGEVLAGTQSLYGFRTQTNGRGLLLGHSLSNITGQLSDAVIQWGGSAGFGVSPGTLQFRSYFNPITPGLAQNHLTLRSNGTSFFGLTPSLSGANNPWVDVVNVNANLSADITGVNVTANNLVAANNSSIGINSFAEAPGFAFLPDFSFTNGSAIGVKGSASAGVAVGVLGDVSASIGVISYGIFGIANPSNGYAGFFDGNVLTSGMYITSDATLKTNVTKAESVLQKISKLNAVTYDYNTETIKYLNLPKGKQNGFIAQELEVIFPEMVKEIKKPRDVSKMNNDLVTFKSVNYIALIPVLTKAIQELNEKVETLEAKLLDKSKNEVFVVTEKLNTDEAKQVANKSYILAQNVPNPFTSSTTIKYKIPENKTATIAVFDLNGKMLLQYPNLKGESQVNINGSTLKAGMYLYSLLVYGEEISTKRMILTK